MEVTISGQGMTIAQCPLILKFWFLFRSPRSEKISSMSVPYMASSFAKDHAESGLAASIHTEVTVLGAMLLDAVAINDATERLRADDFSLDSHRRIYQAMMSLQAVGHAIDYVTVMDALAKKKELESVGGAAYLAFLTEGIPRNVKIEDYVRIVKDKSLLRQLMAVFNEGVTRTSDQSEEAVKVLSDIEANLAAIADSSITRSFSDISTIVASSFGSIDALYEQGREITGLATHYVDLDRITTCLQEA